MQPVYYMLHRGTRMAASKTLIIQQQPSKVENRLIDYHLTNFPDA